MATLPSLLCRVQALYSFESNDPSSLKFDQGDYIDVLAKLPSGWWDGWCHGMRGWFPSNFVKVIEDYGSTVSPSSSSLPPNRRSSGLTDLFDDRLEEKVLDNKLPANWSIQTKEDGSTSYYFNTITGEMRTTYPYENNTHGQLYDGESDEDSATSTIETSHSRSSDVTTDNLLGDMQQHHGKWIQRTTPQGLPFFYNSSTQETAWHADSQDAPKSNRNSTSSSNSSNSLSFDHQEQLTWNKLHIHVTTSIHHLIESSKSAQRALYKKHAASIVISVRYMLVASGTISKDSIYIKTNGILRSHHRAMMASMSKLVLTCQLCSDDPIHDNTAKLLSDGHELLVAVRNFISTCENIPVPVQHVDPILLNEKPTLIDEHHIKTKYQLQSDLVENLYAYGSSMQESMENLLLNLNRHSDSRCSLAVLLFTQYRNFGNQNGQFLSIIEDIDFEHVLQSPKMKDLVLAKQKLYDGLGLLFFKMQTMTDESVEMKKVIIDMTEAAKSIMDAIKMVCDFMADLVLEKSLFLSSSSSSLPVEQQQPVTTMALTFNKRSHSVDSNTNQMTTSPSKLSNRSSAPITDSIMDFNKKNFTFNETQSKHTSAKLKQFFGDDPLILVPPTSPTTTDDTLITPTSITTTNKTSQTEQDVKEEEEEKLNYLQYDYSPNEIVFTVDGSVKGGTLPALVERMTLHDYLDMNFNNTFLLTYRSFCTSMELLELLEARYNIRPPPCLTSEEMDIWITKKQKLVRLRVFNVLKIWLEQYYYDEDSVILDRLLFFTNTSIKDSLSFSAYQLEKLIHKRKEACKDLKKLVITQQLDLPDSILPRNLKKFRLLDLDSTEMARQLTMMDFKLYSSIKPVECLDKAWSRDSTMVEVAVNIRSSIDYCNQVTTWVSDEILSQSEVKKRSTLIKYWVNVAERCRLLNNFNTCMAILSAFDNSAVGRLKRTWEMVGARTNHILSHIRKLMGANRNFNQYRALIHSINPPCIPFLGIYLQDLTFIEDGNPNFLKTSKDLINFAKRAKTAEVIREIQQYQSMGYQFRIVEEIQNFILMNLHSSRDEDQLYKESLKLEPKERDDEKITRLLQESGFL